MRRTQLFTKTQKQAPADEVAKNAQLLIRAGYVSKTMAGVYSYLPLGIKVLENIKQIVREEMNTIGGQELIMSSLQRKETWEPTTRWNDDVVDVWFKTNLKDGTEVGLGWSHEEAIVEMMQRYVESYKDLPVYVYQFQTKMRNELRAKSGIMRGREFVMKDMYSLSTDAEQHEKFYQACIKAYMKVYKRLGIGDDTYVTFASGGAFTEFSHEFQTICDNGEDVIYLHREKDLAVNEEVLDEKNLQKLGLKREELEQVNSAEVGNIFNFGTDKCEQMGLFYTDTNSKRTPVFLGSYGIGITRVMGVLAEKLADERGLVWPVNIAPFHVYLATIGDVTEHADKLYADLQQAGIEVLYDDRDVRPGEKFTDAELMGIPYRVVVSPKTVDAGMVEFVERSGSSEPLLVKAEKLMEILSEKIKK